MNNEVKFLFEQGYPLRIRGNDGYMAILAHIQPLNDGEFAAIYRYPGGYCVHSLEEAKRYEICSCYGSTN